jgi:hypothetical protein
MAPPFFSLTLDEVNCSDFLPGRFDPGERVSVAHWIGWLSPRSSVGALEKRKHFTYGESNRSRPAPNPSIYRLSSPDSTISLELLIRNTFPTRKHKVFIPTIER